MTFPLFQILKKVSAGGGIPTDGLIAEYLFSGNVNDTSGNGYNGVNNGATLTTDRHSNANSAYNFNGTTGYIDISALQPGISSNTTGSISFWIKPVDGSPSVVRSPITFDSFAKTDFMSIYLSNTGLLNVAAYTGTFDWRLYSDNSITTAWQHIILVQDGVEAKVYYNNSLDAVTFNITTNKTAWFNDFVNTQTAAIGTRLFGGAPLWHFDGDIDDVRVYDRVLTADERTALNDE